MRWLKSSIFSKNSIRFKLAIGTLMMALPLIGLLHYYNFYTAHIVHEQVGSSNKNMMSLYMNQVDAGLESVDQYILNLISHNIDIQVMNQPRSDEDFVMAKMSVINKMDRDSLMYKAFVNSIFVYSPAQDSIAATMSDIGGNEYTVITKYIQNELFSSFEGGSVPIHWFVKQIGKEYYLFRLQPVGDLWVGAWVNVKTLQKPLSLIDMGKNGASLFLTDIGIPMTKREYLETRQLQLRPIAERSYQTGSSGQQYHVITESSLKGNFGLSAVVADETVLKNLPYLNTIVIIITIVGVLLIPLYFLYLRKTVLNPLNRIVYAMKRIGDGSLHTRIELSTTSDEFGIVNRSFNNMLNQIAALKISVYEEQLSKQKAELQHLQLQINPHFFMNTLNLIYSLALDKDFELIKDMTMRLVKHFRYMFRSNLTFVPLKDELEHVRNYLAIHELRYQQQFDCRIRVPETLLKAMVPPLIIQTFVENSLKYGSSIESPLVLNITVNMDDSELDPAMMIEIQDEGSGFTDSLLTMLNSGERIVDGQGEHIGAWNAWHRLRILYGDRSFIRYANHEPQGAQVLMRLPFLPDHS